MAQIIQLTVDVQDALAKAKLNDLGIKADKLNQKKVTIKTDINGNVISRVTKLADGFGGLVTTSERWTKNGQKITTVTQQVGDAAGKAGKQVQSVNKAFTLLGTVGLRLAHTAISRVTRSFRDAFKEMQSVDKQLTTVSRITQTSISNLDGLKEKAYEVGSAYGVMASDYLSGVAAFTRAGYREQAEDLAELSTKLQVAGEVSAETANQLLIATDKAYGFNGSVTELSSVMDKMTYVDHNYATSVEKIAEGMGIVAPVAAQAHMSVDELIASLGTITAVTQRSGSESARALRALILSILKDTTTELEDGVTMTVDEVNSVQDALKKYAPEVVKAAEATGELIDPMEAIAALSKSFEEGILTEQKLAEITSSLGGKLRASQLLSLIQNFSGMYTDMMNGMGNSMGIVDKDMVRYLDSWQGKLTQLKNSFAGFAESIFDTDAIKGFIDALNYLIKAIDNPDEYADKFASAFESAIRSLARRLPRVQGAISNVALMIVKALSTSIKTELPTIVKDLAAGARQATHELSKELPEIIDGLMSGIGGMIGQSIVDADLAADIAVNLVTGIAEALPQAIADLGINFWDVISSGFSKKAKSDDSGEYVSNIWKATWFGMLFEMGKSVLGDEEVQSLLPNLSKILSSIFGNNDIFGNGFDFSSIFHKKSNAETKVTEGLSTESARREKIEEKSQKKRTETVSTESAKREKIEEKRAQREERIEKRKQKERIDSLSTAYKREEQLEYKRAQREEKRNKRAKELSYESEKRNKIEQKSAERVIKNLSVESAQREKIEEKRIQREERRKQIVEGLSSASERAEKIEEKKAQREERKAQKEKRDGENRVKSERENQEEITKDLSTESAKREKILYKQTEKTLESIDKEKKAAESFKDKIDAVTKSINGYKKALEGGEKGDTFKSYAEAYKSAIDMLEKGLTGTNAYMQAVDLLLPKNLLRELGYDYEKAGEYLRSNFYKSMFGGGGDDYAAGFANFIRQNKEEFAEYVDVVEEAGGTFGLYWKDVEGFAHKMNISSDAAWSAVEALGAWNSTAEYTREELAEIFQTYAQGATTVGEDGRRVLDLTTFIKNLADGGKTEREIYNIIRATQGLSEALGNFDIVEPENLSATIESAVEGFGDINDAAEEADENDIDVKITSNADEVFGHIQDWINTLRSNSTIDVYVKEHHDDGDIDVNAAGTKSARGGLSLVNEEGAELIYSKGKAWIAGGGEPTITNLPVGAGVFNAKETREILSRSGINSFNGGGYVGGIPVTTASGGKVNLTEEIEKILDELSQYIDKILKKAKKALDKQLEEIDKQIEALEREHDAEEDKNKLEELRLKILEAEKKLAEAENERTVRYFNKETGQWEWMADQKAVADAQKALQEAQEAYDKELAEQEYQAQIQALEDLKEALQDQYNDLADHWQEILDAIKESAEEDVDFESLLAKLGLDSNTTGSIRELIQAIQDYERKLADGTYEIPLDSATTERLLGYSGMTARGDSTLSQMYGMTSADTNAKGTSLYNMSSSSVGGDTNYYINGIKIGSDMLNMTLSQLLSVLPIYANAN